MFKTMRNSDVWVIAGLAVAVCSAKLGAGTLPRISEWVSGLTGESPANETEEADGSDQALPPIVVEALDSESPPAQIIVLPPSNQQSEPSAECPSSKRSA
jgi:hypothetical protein